MLSLTVKGQGASVAVVPMTADSQLRHIEGFFESPFLFPPTSPEEAV